MMPKPAILLCAALLALAASGCIGPYRMDIQQGNALAPETVARLQPGMTKQQVRVLLGTPLLTDPFHQDRWDYIYTFRPGGRGDPVGHTLTLLFRDGALAAAEGDLAPEALRSAPKTN
jgi:outer membrane protein assembly factor BamE